MRLYFAGGGSLIARSSCKLQNRAYILLQFTVLVLLLPFGSDARDKRTALCTFLAMQAA